MKIMIFDFETYSEADIKEVGAYEYSMHPTTEILCISYRICEFEDIPYTQVKRATYGQKPPLDFMLALHDSSILLVAHNAAFERYITQNVLSVRTSLNRWCDTAAMCRAMGLPGGLEDAAIGLGLDVQKDKEGHRIMLMLSSPHEPDFKNPFERYLPSSHPELFRKLYDYCDTDVEVTSLILQNLPMLTPKEQRYWQHDQYMNEHGLSIDRRLVVGALHCIDRYAPEIDAEVVQLTDGLLESARQKSLIDFLASRGVSIPNLQAQTVSEALQRPGLDLVSRRLLELRQLSAKSSTAKFEALERRTVSDGRARENTIFHGAHTGRQTSTGIQVHNLFKSTLPTDEQDAAIEVITNRDLTALTALFNNPMAAIASVLRSSIVAPTGKVLAAGDFSTIEVRVLFWLANHKEGLEALSDPTRDIYLEMYAKIAKMPVAKVMSDYSQNADHAVKGRPLGKATTLGAGFGMGVGGHKFKDSAKRNFGLVVSLSMARSCIEGYRNLHWPVPRLWQTIEEAAHRAVKFPGKTFSHSHISWHFDGKWLSCQLPSGRKLRYFRPRVIMMDTRAGENLVLHYFGVDSETKRFVEMTTWGGELTQNVVQAIARDLLYSALMRLRKAGLNPILAVHDEAVCECHEKDAPKIRGIMEEVPSWAEGVPVKVETWVNQRYRK
jgi:DNA polymerase